MEEAKRPIDAGPEANSAVDETAVELTDKAESEGADDNAAPQLDPSLMEEASALIDNARTYAEAELGFQKTRATFAGQLVGVSLGLVVVALILLHIAFLALAVGLVLAFEPLAGIWGAIGIVFGGLLLVVGLLGWGAFTRVKKLASLFSKSDEAGEA